MNLTCQDGFFTSHLPLESFENFLWQLFVKDFPIMLVRKKLTVEDRKIRMWTLVTKVFKHKVVVVFS